MLSAIKSNKSGGRQWKSLFLASEDSLTSSIFGLFTYLPVELFWSILYKSVYNKLPEISGPIEECEFWPHWNCNDTKNTNFVEPDVFMRFKNFDLIIEAKAKDYAQQNRQQWENEIQAYFNEYTEEKKEVYFLALGGLHNEIDEVIIKNGRNVTIIKCRWKQILYEILRVYETYGKSQYKLSCMESSRFIIKDMIDYFSLHGYAIGKWFEEFYINEYSLKEENNLSSWKLN